MNTHARPLADYLTTLQDTALATLLDRRGVAPDIGWTDLYDAAEALLDPTSIGRALPRLTSSEARTLVLLGRDGTESDDIDAEAVKSLVDLALLSPQAVPYPGVTAAVSSLEAPPEHPNERPQPLLSEDVSLAAAAERAFTTVAAVADLLLVVQDTPLSLLANGSVGAAERRRAAEQGLPTESPLIDDLVAIALDAGVLRATERLLRLTSVGEEWLRRTGAERWNGLAEGFRRRLPPGLRTPEGGWHEDQEWPGAYPWDPAWPSVVEEKRRRAVLLGITAEGNPTPWASPLATGGDADSSSLRETTPAEVDRIFLQNDLTAIAPGPLLPALDLRLRTIAGRESANQASSYRFTATSVATALALGETAEGIVSFLERISLTGVPQPLRYLIEEVQQRHGLVRVTVDAPTGRTLVESARRTLIESIAVDQSFRSLGLTWDGDRLTTRVNRETVFWALTDERYPATLIGEDGEDEQARRPPALPPEREPEPTERYAALISRLRSAQGPDADAAWLDRELEGAVRQRALIAVEVALPDGSSRELVLEATGWGVDDCVGLTAPRTWSARSRSGASSGQGWSIRRPRPPARRNPPAGRLGGYVRWPPDRPERPHGPARSRPRRRRGRPP